MKTFLKRLSLQSALTAILSMNAFADTTPAQLDTTPPPPETALTTDQIPPILSPHDNASSGATGGSMGVGATDGSIGASVPDKTSTPTH